MIVDFVRNKRNNYTEGLFELGLSGYIGKVARHIICSQDIQSECYLCHYYVSVASLTHFNDVGDVTSLHVHVSQHIRIANPPTANCMQLTD